MSKSTNMTKKICFVVPCKHSDAYGDLVENCVESIRKYHPNDKICVVDSDSNNKDYSTNLIDNYKVNFFDIKNKNYGTGALWYIYDLYKQEYDYYFLIHDSAELTNKIEVKDGASVYPVMCGKNWMWPRKIYKNNNTRTSEWAREQCKKHGEAFHENFNSLLGPMFLVSQSLLEKISLTGFYKIRPINKYQTENMERLWALKFTNMGHLEEMINNSFLGDFRQAEYHHLVKNVKVKTHYVRKSDRVQKFWVERL